MVTLRYGLQDGSDDLDEILGAASAEDGSVVLAGYTDGSYDGRSTGLEDIVAVKLDVDGELLWKWQVCA
ncbi:unnamed protein product [Sphacelaria rigidula]